MNFGLTNEKQQCKLPQHDFVVARVCETPSSFRVMTWKTENVKGEEKLIKEADQSLVTVRPKFYIGSSGSRWSSDLLQMRYKNPNLLELRDNSEMYTIPARRFVAQVKDTVCYFSMTTTIGDLCDLVTQSSYYSYELKRLKWLQTRLKKAEQRWQNDTMNEATSS